MPDELLHSFEGYGTGALPRPPDWRDFQIACAPEIAPLVGNAPAADDHLLPFIRGCYNQGSLPSCVAHSSAGMQSINEQMERGEWIEMDAVRAYRDNGGNGSNGVPTQAVLQYMQIQGMPVLNSSLRYKLASYAFAQPMQNPGVEAIKAAIATGHPCVIALLLPSDFMSGMNAGLGSVTMGYHQVAAVAYTPERVIFLNSWGSTYGNNGLGSVPWAYLQRPEQTNYVYAFTEIDSPDDGNPPPPGPSISGIQDSFHSPIISANSGATIFISGSNLGTAGTATFAGMPLIVTAWGPTEIKAALPTVERETTAPVVVRLNSGLTASSNQFTVNLTGPPPVDLTITGYQGAAGSVPQFKGGGPLTVTGTGLDAGVLQVTFGTAQLPVGLRSSISALVTLPAVEVPTCGAIKVQREAMAVSGPPLVVMPGSGPPPSELSVSIAVSKRQTFIGIFAVVHDSSGALVTAQCSGTCGNSLLGQRGTGGSSGVPAAWQAARHDGDAIRIVALAADGRSGIGTSTV